MKNLLVSATAVTVLILAMPGASLGQQSAGAGRYDRQTVWTVSGEVISVDRIADGRRGFHGVHLLLKTAKGDLSVHLGPSWFVDRQVMKVAPHDVIEVTGSPVTYNGKPTLIAAEIRKGGERLQLRTAEGLPLWRNAVARRAGG